MENWDNLSVQWLCRRAQLLSDNGYVHRGLVYQLVAYHMQSSDEGVLRGLAKMFILAGDGVRALEVIKKLEQLNPNAEDLALSLLRSGAHREMGNDAESTRILTRRLDRQEDFE
ncbi:MAG: hypothetical protein ACTIKR_08920 [Advenella sp.]|uniref:hypothetical protein n=1 Tax=Advenella sp. TaxID=1872388 RepID=UPI003F9C2812